MIKLIGAISIPILLAAAPTPSYAESFFQAEIGLGFAHTKDVGDGTWIQYNVPHTESLNSPALLFGLTGKVYSHGNYGLRYHLDYTYISTVRAGCDCVSDADYAAHNYNASRTHFTGSGHTQGISLTLEPTYQWGNYVFGVEAGPWVFWQSWHEGIGINPTTSIRHTPVAQVGWVAGASVSRGNFSLRYRYYNEPQKWNPYPGIANGTHMLLVTYHF